MMKLRLAYCFYQRTGIINKETGMFTAMDLTILKVLNGAKISLLSLVLAGVAASAAAAEKLYIFTEKYPPYNDSVSGQAFAHNENDITGICSDMVKAALARVDYDYVMKMRAWSLSLIHISEPTRRTP